MNAMHDNNILFNRKNFFFTITCLIIIFQLQLSFKATASDPDTLIAQGSLWKYLDNGSDQGTAWTAINFQDSSWSSGNAELGYGDGDETTVVSYGPDAQNKYITTYFRKEFQLTNLSIYHTVRCSIKRDDGAIVYLNGTEIYRSNMPNGPINYLSNASSGISGGAESAFIIFFRGTSPLVNGANELAVEIHQDNGTSSDISFDFSMVADTDAEIARTPYLQLATPNSIFVNWRTSIPEISKVRFGSTMNYSDSISDTTLVITHSLNLTGLIPDTKYYYSINSAREELAGGAQYYFITPPTFPFNRKIRIWAMGDFGTGNIQQNLVRDAYYAYRDTSYTDLVLWLGDAAYPTGTDEQYSYNVFTDHYEKILAKSVVYATAGNHDLYYSNSSGQTGPYYDIFNLPKNGEAGGLPSGTEAYYSFNYGNIHFISLESNIDSFGVTSTNSMINWLDSDLTMNTMHWNIVMFHCPPYSKGYHDSDVDPDMTYMRENVVPILEAHRVDLVLSGHDHDYERSYLMYGHYGLSSTFNTSMAIDTGSGGGTNYYRKVAPDYKGTVYAVVGSGGGLETVQTTWPHPAMYSHFNNEFGSMAIDVDGDTLTCNFVTLDTLVKDHFTIIKAGNIGINEMNTLSDVQVFPNPSAHTLFLQTGSGGLIHLTATITDATGRVLKVIKPENSLTQVNLEQFRSGIYFLTVTSPVATRTIRFVKMDY